jgi:7-carboxy-7-deazaguanine synthase
MPNPNKIPVVEIFGPTIQGEGTMIGKQTFFIRTAGCDYRCTFCDSLHAVDATVKNGAAQIMTAQEIVDEISQLADQHNANGVEWVTLSGGNPALCDFSEVITLLHNVGMKVAIETQGASYALWINDCDQITISPKGPGMISDQNLVMADLFRFMRNLKPLALSNTVLKIPVFDNVDIQFATDIAKMYPNLPLYLSVGNTYTSHENIGYLRSVLLRTYELLLIEIYQTPLLGRAVVLPQLHVLVWGNQQGV